MQQRYEPVQRGGELCFRRFPRLEFLPQFKQFVALVARKQAENALGGFKFTGSFGIVPGNVVDISIAGVNFDNVMHQ